MIIMELLQNTKLQLEILTATLDTFAMLGWSLLFSLIIGLPLGIILFLTGPKQLLSKPLFYAALSFIVNIIRSPPFLILLIMIMPLAKILVGTRIGVLGMIPALVIGAAPFFARLVETALREVDKGVIEAAQSMGTSLHLIVLRVLLPESKSGLISAITVLAITLLSYTALAGVIGGGGLGDLAIRYGYTRSKDEYLYPIVIILVIMVQLIQMLGDYLVARTSRK